MKTLSRVRKHLQKVLCYVFIYSRAFNNNNNLIAVTTLLPMSGLHRC